ncbi:MAG: hypothetical protein WCO63_00490 [Bacteroidota bacterium]
MKTLNHKSQENQDQRNSLSELKGYPLYPDSEDIYKKYHKEADINPEDITHKKTPVVAPFTDSDHELDFSVDLSENDLDIPGTELDDIQENIGSEDEENNYYSLGGDAHHDLDENAG